MKNYVVIGVDPYRFIDKQTGEIREGVSITYLDEKDPTPIQQNNAVPMPYNIPLIPKGYSPIKVSVTNLDFYSKFGQVPGIYDLNFRMKPDKKGRPVISLIDAKYISEVNFNPKKANQK